MKNLTLTAPHPYYPALGDVEVTVSVLDNPPGKPVTSRLENGVEAQRDPDSWTPLTTPFDVPRDRVALVGMLWDLEGQPIHPAHGPRPTVEYALAWSPAPRTGKLGLVVWRRTVELLSSRDSYVASVAGGDHGPDARANHRRENRG